MKMLATIPIVWIGVLSGIATAADDATLKPTPPDVSATVEPFCRDKPYLALVVGIVEPNGQRIHSFGQLNRNGEQIPPDVDTVFEIGSITKTFTAALLAVLVESGRVQLDDPANKSLRPEWQLPDDGERQITLQDLATHTSGLPVQPPLLGLFALIHKTLNNPYSQFDEAALADAMKGMTLSHPIGEKPAYSNLGYGLLGHALADAENAESYEQLLRERVLDPLKLSDTTIQLSASQLARLAQPHTEGGTPTAPWDFATLGACGGLRSTTRDMVRWMDAHLGRMESPLTPALQQTQQVRFPRGRPLEQDERAIGLAWRLVPLHERPRPAVFHNGGTYGSRSFIAFLPNEKLGVVILSNSAHSVDELGFTLLEQLLDRHVPVASQNHQPDP